MGCMAHPRWKFIEALDSAPKESCLVLVLVRRLYKIEERAQGLSLDEVARLRTTESAPAMAELKATIERLAQETTPASRLGKACSYALNQWTSLSAFLRDPRVAIDNNAIERNRPVTVNQQWDPSYGNRGRTHRHPVLLGTLHAATTRPR